MVVFNCDGERLSGTGTPLDRRKRALRWLRDRLAARGVEAHGPVADMSGWRLAVSAEDGLVTIRLAPGAAMRVIVDKQGEADAEYEDTVAACGDALSGAATPFDFDLEAENAERTL